MLAPRASLVLRFTAWLLCERCFWNVRREKESPKICVYIDARTPFGAAGGRAGAKVKSRVVLFLFLLLPQNQFAPHGGGKKENQAISVGFLD